jgi:hypothetical protein
MGDTIKTAVFLVAVFVGLPVLILWIRDRFVGPNKRRSSRSEVNGNRSAYLERILHPNWEFYERHLQRQAPSALRQLYADHAFVVSQSLDCGGDDYINTFGALDEQAIVDTRRQLGFDVVAIATTDLGDPVYLRPGKSECDTVYVTHHDGGRTEVFAESVAALMAKLGHENKTA